MNRCHFTKDWFTTKKDTYTKFLAPYIDKPDLHYLELGVFEGQSLIWMLETVLRHPTARVTCIDIFKEDLRERFLTNLDQAGFAHKVTTIKGAFRNELRKLPFEEFDIIYLDGAHKAPYVLENTMLCWPLLKKEGLMIFDDYLWKPDNYPAEFGPKIAIDAFLSVYKRQIKLLYCKSVVVLKKRE